MENVSVIQGLTALTALTKNALRQSAWVFHVLVTVAALMVPASAIQDGRVSIARRGHSALQILLVLVIQCVVES